MVAVDGFTGHYPAADKWANLSGLLGQPGFELHRLNLATADLGHLLAGAAAVFHLAAKPGVHTSFGPASPPTSTTTCWPLSGCWRPASWRRSRG